MWAGDALRSTRLGVEARRSLVVRLRLGRPAGLAQGRSGLDGDLVVVRGQRRGRLVLRGRVSGPAHGRQEVRVPGAHRRVVRRRPVRLAVPFFRLGHPGPLQRHVRFTMSLPKKAFREGGDRGRSSGKTSGKNDGNCHAGNWKGTSGITGRGYLWTRTTRLKR